MKTILALAWLGFISAGNGLFGQHFLPTYSDPQKGTNTKNSYLKNFENKKDTSWLYRNEETFLWDGSEYISEGVYFYYQYGSIIEYGKYDRMYIINSNSNDTINRTSYWYDENKRVKEFVFENYNTITATYEKMHRTTYFYDDFGNDTLLLIEKWNEENDAWVNDLRFLTKFNSDNFLLEDVKQKWYSLYWIQESGYKYEYIIENNCTLPDTMVKYKWNSANKGWDNYIIKYWVYNDSMVPTEYVYELWDEGTGKYTNYQRFSQLDYTNWPGCNNLDHNYDQQFYFFLQQDWYGEWKNTVRLFAEYDTLGGRFSKFEKYYDNQWINFERYELRFNEKGKHLFQMREQWKNNTWTAYLGDTSIYHYEGPKLVTWFYNRWDTITNAWVNWGKTLYSDFIWHLGVDESLYPEQSGEGRVKIIPNPASDEFKVVLLYPSVAVEKISIFELAGKTVLTFSYHDRYQKTINVSLTGISKGIYVVKTMFYDKSVCFNKVIVD